ncbi:Integrase catalytic domain-containing protein [Aphis craccivora]|uniref:Integrase catalytic domain-containing protein n=1 Tax=Aphis craccivora TaxID=307492 RepID=A0A6G0XXH9_APHCR|nr:Integrase catalytic domain-containing protein [Aphis craccivora]
MQDKVESQRVWYNFGVYRNSKNHRAIINSVSYNAIKNTEIQQLADPQFWALGRVKMLTGAEIFYKLICPGQHRQNSIPPLLFQETMLGWVASGKINHFNTNGSKAASATVHFDERLEQSIQSFWELEEVNSAKKLLYKIKGLESMTYTNPMFSIDFQKIFFNQSVVS